MEAKKLEILMTAVDLGSFSKAFPDRTGKGAGAGYPAVPSGKCQSGKSDPDYYQATDGNYPDCRLCQYGHVLDAGNIVPFSQDLPKSGCRPADGG